MNHRTDVNGNPTESPVNGFQTRETIGGFFRRLRFRLIVGLLLAFTLPYGTLILFFHFQFTRVLNDTSKLHLISLSESQRNTLDLFLRERVINLFGLFHSPDFATDPDQQAMKAMLDDLKTVSGTFTDLGFLNASGIQIGYAGPHTMLRNRDYSAESWFKAIIDSEKNYLITDIYLGFRNKPHFTIAVKQLINGIPFIMRSTLEPDQFYEFLETISQAQGVESMLINSSGIYQVVGPRIGRPFQESDYVPTKAESSGITEISSNGDTILLAHSWLKETDWALLVRQPLGITYARMYSTRRIITLVLLVVLMAFAIVIYLTTGRLIHYARDASEKRDEMRLQLVHATKLASIGELSAGIAHEINNPLAIIFSTGGVIRDLFNPEFNLDWTYEEVLRELESLQAAARRIQSITSKLLEFGRKNEPRLVDSDINRVLDNVIDGLIEREFKVIDINILRDYESGLPPVAIDPDQISQVFLNLINNARDAIEGPGTITITTRREAGKVKITVTDTGRGMSIDQLKQIFNPFYTTKEVGKGTGLGLGIALNIVESMGGTIDVQSMEGKGSSFMIALPVSLPDQPEIRRADG